jgi:hypothetical protein
MTRRLKRWRDAWLHSDLVGIPVTVALLGIVLVLVLVFLLIGKAAGAFADKLLFPLALGVLLVLFLFLGGRRKETTEGLSRAPAGSPRRVLVIANQGLETSALCEAVCDRAQEIAGEAMIVAPVTASSPLRALADDTDAERNAAQARVDKALEILRERGIACSGHVDIGQPLSVLVDGMRELAATEVVMLRGGEAGWEDAGSFAERVRTELGMRVTEVDASSET